MVKNAVANVGRGSAGAFVAVLLPPFLTRLMTMEAYGAWALILQVTAFVGYLDLGVQTAVGRFVAHSGETGDSAKRDQSVGTALVILGACGGAAIVTAFFAAALLPRIFTHFPVGLIHDAQIALLLVATSLAVGLPASVLNGIFAGLQRYEVPAMIVGGSRLIGALLLIVVVKSGGGLAAMGALTAFINLASYGVQFLAYRRMATSIRLSPRLASRKSAVEFFDYCFSLTVWSFAMLLVTGLDVLLVGYFQFEAVPYYAVAATLVTFLSGLQNAVFGVMIPSAAVQHAKGNSRELGATIIRATRYGAFLLLLTGLPLVFWARTILKLWVGAGYSIHGTKVLQILIAANIIRLSAVPYIMTLVGTGQQRLVILTPILEGVSNLLASIIAGYFFGAMGVAFGTVVGALVGVAGNFFYNMRRTNEIGLRLSEYMRDGLLRPALCSFPLLGLMLLRLRSYSLFADYWWILAATLLTLILVWRWGLVGNERNILRSSFL